MAQCKYCQKPFQWGRTDDRWVPLVPVADQAGLELLYQDENGVLRAPHAQVCVRTGGSVHITRLPQKVKFIESTSFHIDPQTGEIREVETT
jgi:hypothetical protein